MATDSQLDKTLSMLDQEVVVDGHEDIEKARALARRLGLPFDPLDFIEHLDELPFDPNGEPDIGR